MPLALALALAQACKELALVKPLDEDTALHYVAEYEHLAKALVDQCDSLGEAEAILRGCGTSPRRASLPA